MKTIDRQNYTQKIEQWMGKGLIIVLTGQRRVGKSHLLQQMRNKLSQSDNVIYIDKEKHEFDNIRTYQDLNAYIDSHLAKGQINHILIDEIQDITDFERSLRSYYSEPKTNVIVTGSNAQMLSSEITTLIGGRYKEIYIQPLDYKEFVELHQLEDSDLSLSKYIEFGGMPGLARIGLEKTAAYEYLHDLYNSMLLKDVVMRNRIRNAVYLDKLVQFMAQNEGKLMSANNICKYIKNTGAELSPAIVINYQKYLADAHIIQQVNRYDIRGKRIFESHTKCYFEDHGIRNAIAGGNRDGDIEKVLESIVCQHLIRQGYRVQVGQLQAGEVDFVCSTSSGKRAYVQVCYIVANEATRQREFGNLRRIGDDYPKFVISLSPMLTSSDDNGITHLHLKQFLSKGLRL